MASSSFQAIRVFFKFPGFFCQDKYLLVERATNMAAAAELNCFGMLGLTPQQLSTLKQWTSGAGSPLAVHGSWCREATKVVRVI